jgi:hypothetical protein
LNLVNGSQN